ncbi:Na+/H+ antiporter subunit E [Pseudomonas aeruginosa]|jgi:multicomponent Na+:H+ antiporter subunit E|uniref:Na+/H+ antiporter subunit E n=1 Tax=Pseudomonas aeruginosa TaxID=287 RepID=UPI001F3F24DE|nr:Na+/H+ antiporter subunit E [Pseudomonas aeruginosa]
MQPTQHLDPHPGKPATPVKTATARALAVAALLALLWFVLAGGDAASWIVGVPAVAAALLLARRVGAPPPAWRLDPAGALRFAAFFVRESMRGGIDVAGRVSARRPRVAPGLVHYRWRLPAGSPGRALFVLCASLLPGTLVAAADDHEVLIHALDATAPVAGELAALEEHVAALFALRLPAPEAAGA